MHTRRLDLIGGTAPMLRAELVSSDALAIAVDAHVPESWPPELYDADAVRWTLDWLEKNPDDAGWGFYYVALRDADGRRRLVGVSGYKGAPVDGVVEVGYGVVPEHRRQGYALEAVMALVDRAFADPRVRVVSAHTLAELTPSIGVLTKAGFSFMGQGDDPQEPTAIRYELSRATYEATRST